jgi:hypothetical protein
MCLKARFENMQQEPRFLRWITRLRVVASQGFRGVYFWLLDVSSGLGDISV